MFWIDASQDFTVRSPCSVCGGDHDLTHDLADMQLACTALAARRAAGPDIVDDEALRVVGLRSDGPGFVEMELAAALALADDALSLTPEIEDLILPYLVEAMNADQVYEAMAVADSYWRRNSFKPKTKDAFESAMILAVATGAVTFNDASVIDDVFRRRIVDGMVRASKYYSNEFFNRQVMPALVTSVEKALAGDTPASLAGYRFVQATLKQRLKSVPYWSVVANVAASRSYHYGMTRAAMGMGRTVYEYVALLDARTSQICQFLNGKQWLISDAVNLMERIASAEDPEEVKEIAPWPKLEDLQGRSAAEFADMGAFMPPQHANCRSTIQIR